MEQNKIPCSYIPQKEVRGPCVFIVRDPVSRFCSLWRSKCRDKANIADKSVWGMSSIQLLEHIESGARDVHWTPQYKLIGNLKPKIIPLEKLNDWWLQFGELGYFNKTDEEIPDINPKHIVDYYWKDMELYTKAVMSYDEEQRNDLLATP